MQFNVNLSDGLVYLSQGISGVWMEDIKLDFSAVELMILHQIIALAVSVAIAVANLHAAVAHLHCRLVLALQKLHFYPNSYSVVL